MQQKSQKSNRNFNSNRFRNQQQTEDIEFQQPKSKGQNTPNLTKNSFRGSIKYSNPNKSGNNFNNQNSSYRNNANSSDKLENTPNIQKQNNLNSNNSRNGKSFYENQKQQQRKKTNNNSNNNNYLDNDELRDYKSKIKNKYNIDYDHSLDEEYEIIEAIE